MLYIYTTVQKEKTIHTIMLIYGLSLRQYNKRLHISLGSAS